MRELVIGFQRPVKAQGHLRSDRDREEQTDT